MVLQSRDPLVDAYSAYDYKPMFRGANIGAAPTWVDKANRRRLQAYILLKSYLENAARAYVPNTDDPDARREYGDANLIVETLVDAVLGEDARVMVRGARRTEEKNKDAYADTLQDFFDKWVEDEMLHMTVTEAEEDAVGLGDGVFVMGWDANKERVVVNCYDPGFYFPVIDPATYDYSYPRKIHIAWEYEDTTQEPEFPKKYIRRITYELVDDGPSRKHPWNRNSTTVTCLKSDGTWSYEDQGTRQYLDLDESRAKWAVNADGVDVHNLDIEVDFIPVVHLPNTISRKEHFGRSALQYVMQVLDDIHSADTDLLKSARTTGSPPLGSKGPVEKGEDGKVTTYGPGSVIQGEITVIDTSRNLDALLKYLDFLLKRLSTNVRMPESVLGKLRPSEVPSGIALALSFGPLRSLVRRMRLARSEKYKLLFKFALRFAMISDESLRPPADRVNDMPVVEYAFGQFLPSDVTIIVQDILRLVEQKVISKNTAIRLLIEDAGYNIRDANDEVEAVQAEDFEGAKMLAEAVESPDTAAEYLGVKIAAVNPVRIEQMERENEAAIAQAKARGFGRPGDGGDGSDPAQNGNGQQPKPKTQNA